MKKPNLFIVGAPKCGTTAMAYYLNQHPNVFFSEVKEPHYFNFDSNHRYYFTEAEYLKNFTSSTNKHNYIAEGSVWYMYSQIAIDNILAFNPKSKFIVMLRNPVDMYFSLHQELLFGGSENVSSPLLAWNLQEQRLKGEKIPLGCSDNRFLQYGDSCSLGKQVEELLKKVSKEDVKFILLDELKEDTNKVYQSVLKFLGLEEFVLNSYEVVNKKKIRKSYMLSTFFKYVVFIKQKLGIKKGLGIANRINKKNVKSGLSISDKKEIEELTPILKDYFEKDIIKLEKLISKDLSSWK